MNSKFTRGITFLVGPLLFFIIQSIPIEGLSDEGKAVLACTSWIAFWWITEPVELSVTSLLPIIIFPLSGAMPIKDTTTSYGDPIIFLYLGGFIVGLAVERWNLHKRIAFNIIKTIGSSHKRILLGLMTATAFLSMWISNTASAIMMLPIGISIINQFNHDKTLSKNLMLGIAYSASIGGMATLIGTPPNLILAGVVKESLDYEISFFNWMLFALPLCVLLLFIIWLYLSRNDSKTAVKKNTLNLEPLDTFSKAEKRVGFVFILTAFLWITRSFIINPWLPIVDDTMIALFGALLMFFIPSGDKSQKNLMNWESTRNIPWDVLILFGAGLAIAKGFSTTDLTAWLGENFSVLEFLPVALIMLLIFASINFLTEITSNTATASMLLPILITIGISLNIDVLPLLAGSALAASCAFMLPVATPPNAIVFSSGKVSIQQMMRTGFLLNLTSVVLVYLAVEFIWPLIFPG